MMTDDSQQPEHEEHAAHPDNDFDWLLEPPDAHEVKITVAIGEEARLTPAVQVALEQLAQALEESEVSGYLSPIYGNAASLTPQFMRVCFACAGAGECGSKGKGATMPLNDIGFGVIRYNQGQR